MAGTRQETVSATKVTGLRGAHVQRVREDQHRHAVRRRRGRRPYDDVDAADLGRVLLGRPCRFRRDHQRRADRGGKNVSPAIDHSLAGNRENAQTSA
jgi:hypothetical protein